MESPFRQSSGDAARQPPPSRLASAPAIYRYVQPLARDGVIVCAVNTALVLLFLAAVAGGAPRFLGLLVPYAIMVSFITWKLISDRYSLLLEPQSGRITLLTLSPRPWRGWQVIGEEPVERIVDIQIAQTQLRRPMYYLVLAFEGGAEVRFSAPLAHKAALRERAKLARWLDNARSVAAKEAHRRPIAPYLLGSP